jgi:hypothetical protein
MNVAEGVGKQNYVYVADNYENGKEGEEKKKESKMPRRMEGNTRQNITFDFRRIGM